MSRKIVNVAEAKAHLPELMDRAANGEEIILARAGVPRALLIPFDAKKTSRVPGKGKGRLKMKAGFDDPLPESTLADFEVRDLKKSKRA